MRTTFRRAIATAGALACLECVGTSEVLTEDSAGDRGGDEAGDTAADAAASGDAAADAAAETDAEAEVAGCDDGFMAGLLCCDGRCVNPLNDPAHCGGCGRPCSDPLPFCLGGSCQERPCSSSGCGRGTFCCGTSCCTAGQVCCNVDGTGPSAGPACYDEYCPGGCPPCL
jgi:hypothetical protein